MFNTVFTAAKAVATSPVTRQVAVKVAKKTGGTLLVGSAMTVARNRIRGWSTDGDNYRASKVISPLFLRFDHRFSTRTYRYLVEEGLIDQEDLCEKDRIAHDIKTAAFWSATRLPWIAASVTAEVLLDGKFSKSFFVADMATALVYEGFIKNKARKQVGKFINSVSGYEEPIPTPDEDEVAEAVARAMSDLDDLNSAQV